MMDKMLLDAIQRINKTAVEFSDLHILFAEKQAKLGMDLSKLLLAIQGDQAAKYISMEAGNEPELRQIYNLCNEAQNLDYEEMQLLSTIGHDVDKITKCIIEKLKE